MGYTAYIGTNSIRNSKGIYTLSIEDSGRLEIAGSTPAYNSGYLAISRAGTRLYAVSEGMSFKGRANGGVLAYDISGGLPRLMNSRSSGGQRPCCIALPEDKKRLYAANFFGGSLAVFDLEGDGSLGKRRALIKEEPLPGRLDGMHCVEPIGGSEFGAVYLGTGSVIIYDAETFGEKQRFSLENGAFPRHFTASEDGNVLYLLLQTPAQLHVARRDASGNFRAEQVFSTTPEVFSGHAEAAAVRLTPNGRLLLASTRIADSIAVFPRLADGSLEKPNIVPLPVKTPRDICVTSDGRLLLTTGQATDDICIHEIDYDKATLRPFGLIGGIVSPGSIAVKEAG